MFQELVDHQVLSDSIDQESKVFLCCGWHEPDKAMNYSQTRLTHRPSLNSPYCLHKSWANYGS